MNLIKNNYMEKIYYKDKQRVISILNQIKNDGDENLHFLSDFDRTMSYGFIDGEKKMSIIRVMRNSPKYLGEEYSQKANELFNIYHPYEIDHDLDLEKKSEKMLEWWKKHLDLLVKSWLKKKDISDCINSGIVKMRPGIIELLEETNKRDIPFVIISANWLGWDSIRLYLEKNNILFNNIDIISNEFEFDWEWKAIWYKDSIVHVFNKSELAIWQFPKIHKSIENRKNVILLWDSLWDIWMVEWFDYKNLIKIGFYNDLDEKWLDRYLEIYDIIITWDSDVRNLRDILQIF